MVETVEKGYAEEIPADAALRLNGDMNFEPVTTEERKEGEREVEGRQRQ